MKNSKAKPILFACFGDFSHINANLEKQLSTRFPESDIEILDLRAIIKRRKWLVVVNLLYLLIEYAKDFILLRKDILELRKYFLGTSFLFRHMSAVVKSAVRKNSYRFVFQTQCLFSAQNPENVPYYIYTDHTNLNNLNYPLINPNHYLRSKKCVQLERTAYRQASMIFVISNNIKESLIRQYGIDADKIARVYIGSNTNSTGHVDVAKYSNKNIVFVGKDWERKGGDVLLQAFDLVCQKIPQASLTIVGCTPKIHRDNVVLAGPVSVQDVSGYYDKASVFCMPTKREPFGIVFVEAMFHRLGIVTNRTGATGEFVQDGKNGYLLHHDPGAYAEKLVDLLEDPKKCQDFGAHSYEIVRHKYTWEHVGKAIAKSINRIQ